MGLAGALAVGCQGGGGTRGATEGGPAPALSGRTIDGGTADLATFRGRAVLVNFWGSWCTPCKKELPRLAAVARDGLPVLGVAVNDSDRLARELAAASGVGYPSLSDPKQVLAARWGVGQGLPVTFAIDAGGAVRGRHFGEASDEDLAALRRSAGA